MNRYKLRMLRIRRGAIVSAAAALLVMSALVAPAFARDGDRDQERENSYHQTNLVSDIPGFGIFTDAKSEESLGSFAWARDPVVGVGPEHRRLDVI